MCTVGHGIACGESKQVTKRSIFHLNFYTYLTTNTPSRDMDEDCCALGKTEHCKRLASSEAWCPKFGAETSETLGF